MQLLTAAEARAWVVQRGYRDRTKDGPPDLDLSRALRQRFTIPSDAGARVALARFLWHHIGASAPECVVWIATRSIWPSGEHLPLFTRWRQGFGATQSIADAPAMLFRIGEEEDALSALLWPFLFLWDAYLVLSHGDSLLEVSHDEWCILSVKDPATAEAMAEGFRSLHIEVEALTAVAG